MSHQVEYNSLHVRGTRHDIIIQEQNEICEFTETGENKYRLE